MGIKCVPKADKESDTTLDLTVKSRKRTASPHSHNIDSEVLGQTDRDTLFVASVYVITYEAWLVDYVGQVLNTYVSNNHSGSYSMQIS